MTELSFYYGLVALWLALAFAAFVQVEPKLVLAAFAVFGDQLRESRRRGKTIAECAHHHSAHLVADIDANFIGELNGPNRESPIDHCRIDVFDRNAFLVAMALSIAAVLLTSGLTAALLPARRAAAIDPAVALRRD